MRSTGAGKRRAARSPSRTPPSRTPARPVPCRPPPRRRRSVRLRCRSRLGTRTLNDARAQTLFPELKRSSADPDSVGFTSLLQLADAGVQLEKRTGRGEPRDSADARARGKKAKPAAAGRAANGARGAKRGGKKGGDDDDDDAARSRGKKRGRGPNKVQETEEEREAKRQRRVQANRESARQTIRRKHEQYDDLNGRASALEASNAAALGDGDAFEVMPPPPPTSVCASAWSRRRRRACPCPTS